MTTPFQIRDEIERILATCADHETGEITDEAIAQLDALELDLRERVLEYAAYAKSERAEAGKIERLAEDLKERATKHANRAARLERAIEAAMTPGTQKFEDERAAVRWHKGPPYVEITDASKLPKPFWRYPQPPPAEPNKVELAKALKAGPVEGAELKPGRYTLKIE